MLRRTCRRNVGDAQPASTGGQCASEVDLFDGDNLRDVVLQHIFDPMLQRRAGGRASGARALHVEADDALTVASEHDVAAVTGHGRANAGVEQLLDLVDDLLVLRRRLLHPGRRRRSRSRAGRRRNGP